MPAEGRVEFEVPAHAAGTRLDRFLAEPLGSRARAQSLIDSGRVTVDGCMRAKRYLLSSGARIVVEDRDPEIEAEAAEVSLEIAHEDEHLLVVDKPAGLVVHPGRGHRTGTLAQALAGRGAGGDEPWRAGLVHRLDRDTSGLLVVAKHDDAHRALKQLIAKRLMRREYLALVQGTPDARTGTVDAPIGRDRRNRVLMSVDTDDPRAARTHFEVLQLLDQAALLRVVLETGRTHQIRVHMAAIGHPVCGDRQYGGGERYGLERQFLHAARLAFEHPITALPVDLRSELPPDLSHALELASVPVARSRSGQ